jgi:hypothetical protein
MNGINRTLLSAVGAALACAALAGPMAAQDPPRESTLGQTSASMSGREDAQSVIASWPAKTRKAAQALIEEYGRPDGVTARKLTWNDKDPWKEVAVYRDAVKHAMPMPHEDFLENTISYDVPADKVADLAKFDGSLVVDLTRGTLASHCDSEKSNILALNLANEIVTGKRDVASAKGFLKTTMRVTLAGKSSPYTDKLMFSGSQPAANPAEEPTIKKNMEPAQPEPVEPMPGSGY